MRFGVRDRGVTIHVRWSNKGLCVIRFVAVLKHISASVHACMQALKAACLMRHVDLRQVGYPFPAQSRRSAGCLIDFVVLV